MAIVAALHLLWVACALIGLAVASAIASMTLRWFAARRPALSLRAPGLATFTAFVVALVVIVALQAVLRLRFEGVALVLWGAYLALSYATSVLLYRALFRFEREAFVASRLQWAQAAWLALPATVLLAMLMAATYVLLLAPSARAQA